MKTILLGTPPLSRQATSEPIEVLAGRLGAHPVATSELLDRMMRVLELDRAPKHWIAGREWICRRGSPDHFTLARHLLGQGSLHVEVPAETRLIRLDLDTPDDEVYSSELLDRFVFLQDERLRTMLGDPARAAVRSSPSRGAHLFVPLLELADGATLQERLLTAVQSRPIRGLEVFCRGHLRVPLGRGSCLLDPETLRPMHARDWGRGVRRDLWRSIESLCEQIEGARHPIARLNLPPARPNPSPHPPSLSPPMRRIGEQAPSLRVPQGEGRRGREFFKLIEENEGGIGDRHTSNDVVLARTWKLRVMAALPPEDVMAEMLHWFDQGEHDSPMTRDELRGRVRSYLRRLEQRIDAGEVVPGMSGQSMESHVEGLRSDPRWRHRTASLVQPVRHPNPRLARGLTMLAGAIRSMELGGADLSREVTVSFAVAERLVGKDAFPAEARHGLPVALSTRPSRGTGLSAGKVLLDWARHLGLLTRTGNYEVEVTARRFRVGPIAQQAVPLAQPSTVPLPYEPLCTALEPVHEANDNGSTRHETPPPAPVPRSPVPPDWPELLPQDPHKLPPNSRWHQVLLEWRLQGEVEEARRWAAALRAQQDLPSPSEGSDTRDGPTVALGAS
jgi:hypothetical protein